MSHQDGMHGATARAARIRRAHDMEATWLDSMHRRSDLRETGERASVISRMLHRVRRRTTHGERLRAAAPEK
jgi:hypothetical protein